jgi:hypothetical protein
MEDKVGSKEKSFGMKFLQAYFVIFSVSTIQPTIEKVHISDIPCPLQLQPILVVSGSRSATRGTRIYSCSYYPALR